MRITGKQTVVNDVVVEIDLKVVFSKIRSRAIPIDYDHMYNGKWYAVTGHDYHKREDVYEIAADATQEEIELMAAIDKVEKFVKDNM